MKIKDITIFSLLGVLIYIIIVILSLNIEITLKKKPTPAEVTVLVEQPPMMYTWDAGDECYEK